MKCSIYFLCLDYYLLYFKEVKGKWLKFQTGIYGSQLLCTVVLLRETTWTNGGFVVFGSSFTLPILSTPFSQKLKLLAIANT